MKGNNYLLSITIKLRQSVIDIVFSCLVYSWLLYSFFLSLIGVLSRSLSISICFPTYFFLHPVQLIVTPSLGSVLSLRWTKRALSLERGFIAEETFLFLKILASLSDTPLTYRVTLPSPYSSLQFLSYPTVIVGLLWQ